MNNISLVISGNLTGFSRFYASPTANDILNEAKFDFDYRNFLTFLNSGEKAYAISFAPSVLAVSLITRILDSFRRPGVLVVTLLLPRRSKVESAINPQNKNALYQLLNEINSKFYEKNFVNGMVNQNAAVLMQDYYTEILGNYNLVPDGMQRNINGTIEVTSPNKRLGYVQTSEDNVPSYLASLCRRSYEGCHHVFFAQNPVQNLIAEEPVEVVYYRVQITNNRQTLPSVTLNDRIPNVRPEEGEIDIDKNFTYQQVLNGEAGRNIVADLRGETIEITYRFGLEEKSIRFVFSEGGKEIPFTSIMPVLEFNGTFINIPSETYTFQGKEIYGPKRIKSRGTEYRIKRESENLDLRRLQDTCIIQVEHCFSLRIFFNQPEDKPKRIIFKSNHGQFPFTDVTNHLEAELPGYQEEYSYTIESPYYERETGYLPSGSQIQLPQLKPVSRTTPPTRQGGLKVSNIPMEPIGRQVTVHNGRRDARSNETYAHSAGRQSGGAIQLGGENIHQEQFPKPKDDKFIKAIPYVSGVLCIGIAYFLIALFTNIWPFSDDKNNQNVAGEIENEQLIRILFEDATHDQLTLADFKDFGSNFNEFDNLVDVILQNDLGQPMMPDNSEIPSDDIWYLYKLRVPNNENIKYTFQLKTKQLNIGNDVFSEGIVIGSSNFNSDDIVGKDSNVYDKKVKLSIKTSELLAYKKALDFNLDNNKELSHDEIKRISKTAQDLLDSRRCNELGNLILKLIKPAEEEASKKAEEEAKKKAERRAEEEKKKAEKKEKTTTPVSADNNLPGAIAGRVQRGRDIKESSDVFKKLPDGQKAIIRQYNSWVKSEYEQMKQKGWEGQKAQIDAQLAKINTFTDVKKISATRAFRPKE